MECRIENQDFCIKFDELLEKLIIIYSKSETYFLKIFMKMPQPILTEILRLSHTQEYLDTKYEDTADIAGEIFFYFKSEYDKFKIKEQQKTIINNQSKRYKPFTLRNNDDLAEFELFLDKMLKLLSLSQSKFLEIFPKCPMIYWDKIDDLRETSFKSHRDSLEYTRCLEKCKTISYAFSNLSDTKDNTDDEY